MVEVLVWVLLLLLLTVVVLVMAMLQRWRGIMVRRLMLLLNETSTSRSARVG